jgi:hypothetical protein
MDGEINMPLWGSLVNPIFFVELCHAGCLVEMADSL